MLTCPTFFNYNNFGLLKSIKTYSCKTVYYSRLHVASKIYIFNVPVIYQALYSFMATNLWQAHFLISVSLLRGIRSKLSLSKSYGTKRRIRIGWWLCWGMYMYFVSVVFLIDSYIHKFKKCLSTYHLFLEV